MPSCIQDRDDTGQGDRGTDDRDDKDDRGTGGQGQLGEHFGALSKAGKQGAGASLNLQGGEAPGM